MKWRTIWAVEVHVLGCPLDSRSKFLPLMFSKMVNIHVHSHRINILTNTSGTPSALWHVKASCINIFVTNETFSIYLNTKWSHLTLHLMAHALVTLQHYGLFTLADMDSYPDLVQISISKRVKSHVLHHPGRLAL